MSSDVQGYQPVNAGFYQVGSGTAASIDEKVNNLCVNNPISKTMDKVKAVEANWHTAENSLAAVFRV